MPIKKAYLQSIESLAVSPSTKEATVLKAVNKQETPVSVGSLSEAVDLPETSLRGALRRLREKDVVVRVDGGHALADEAAEELAEALH